MSSVDMRTVFDFHQQRIVMSGGSGVLGESMVRALVHHGATVVVLTRNPGATQQKFADVPAGHLEFVAIDHTPRNLLIRATYSGTPGDRSNYERFCEEWAVKPYLEKLLS